MKRRGTDTDGLKHSINTYYIINIGFKAIFSAHRRQIITWLSKGTFKYYAILLGGQGGLVK